MSGAFVNQSRFRIWPRFRTPFRRPVAWRRKGMSRSLFPYARQGFLENLVLYLPFSPFGRLDLAVGSSWKTSVSSHSSMDFPAKKSSRNWLVYLAELGQDIH